MRIREKILVGLVVVAALCALFSVPLPAQRGGSTQAAAANWAISNAPTVSNQATVSKPAVPGWRHVAGNVCISGNAVTSVTVAAVSVNLRDGATGAGTILASWTFGPNGTGNAIPAFCSGPLNIGGSVNTPMTIEFSGLVTNLSEDVTLVGFDIPQ